MTTREDFFALDDVEQLRRVGGALSRESNPAEVFGYGVNYKVAKARYRKLSKHLHPDVRSGSEDDDLAGFAFNWLHLLWKGAEQMFKDGTYGEATIDMNSAVAAKSVEVRGVVYEVRRLLVSGDVGDYYLLVDESGREYAMHISRTPANNDLIENEANVLDKINSHPAFVEFEGYRYIPELVARFQTTDGLSANIWHVPNFGEEAMLPSLENMVPLSAVVDLVGRENIDLRHVGWIWNRVITGLSAAHYMGVVHAGVTPDSIWISIDPDNHAGLLTNWVHASAGQSQVGSISARWRDHYPPEILSKELPLPSTDYFMGAKAVLWAFDQIQCSPSGNPLDRYFFVMTLYQPNVRLKDDASVYEEFQDVLFNQMRWKREFVRLEVNNKSEIDWSWFW